MLAILTPAVSRETVPDDSCGIDLEAAHAGSELERGATLGRFEILEKLGAGGMGLVYRARDPRLRRDVAIKVLRAPARAYRRPEQAQARLLREAQAMAKVSHTNVLSIHEVSSVEGVVFLVMELVEGGTLASWIADAQPAWRAVLRAYVGAGRGLAAAHDAGLVHRDFKPSNVLMGDDGSPRVTDFGLVGALQDGDADTATSREPGEAPITIETLATAGTPAYMAPEQRAGRGADARSDQFSFCVSLYEGLCGERPSLQADDEPSAAEPRALERKLPLRLRRALRRGLSPNPMNRFASMTELLAELEPALGPRRPVWPWVLGATAALAAGLGVWNLRRSTAEATLPPVGLRPPAAAASVGSATTEPQAVGSVHGSYPLPTSPSHAPPKSTARASATPAPRPPKVESPLASSPPPSGIKPSPSVLPPSEENERSERVRKQLRLEE